MDKFSKVWKDLRCRWINQDSYGHANDFVDWKEKIAEVSSYFNVLNITWLWQKRSITISVEIITKILIDSWSYLVETENFKYVWSRGEASALQPKVGWLESLEKCVWNIYGALKEPELSTLKSIHFPTNTKSLLPFSSVVKERMFFEINAFSH